MKPERVPTNGENVTSRLFLRFFLCYLLSVPIGWLLAVRGVLPVAPSLVGTVEFLFVPLALLGGLLILTGPYLLALTVLKGLYDMAWLYHVTQWTVTGGIGIFQWNLCFLLLVLSLLLFCFAAARAELFSFLCTARNMRLLFSRTFLQYLLESLLMTGLALSLYFLWPMLCERLGMIPVPLK